MFHVCQFVSVKLKYIILFKFKFIMVHIMCSADKMMVINCLMNQILTFSSYRVQLQNTVIKIKNDRLEVKSALAAEKKKAQEIVQK